MDILRRAPERKTMGAVMGVYEAACRDREVSIVSYVYRVRVLVE